MSKSIIELNSMVGALETKFKDKKLRFVDDQQAAYEEICSVLNELDHFLEDCMLYQFLDKSSEPSYLEEFSTIDALKRRLKTLSCSINLQKNQRNIISRQIPEAGKEAEYRSKIGRSKALKKNDNRTYIQQKYLGVAEADCIVGKPIAFLATSGIASCVGYILFSRDKKKCVLAHVDDVFGASQSIIDSNGISISKEKYYDQLTQQALTLLDNPDPSSVEAILITSELSLSNDLAVDLNTGLTTNGVSNVSIRTTDSGEVSFRLGIQDYQCEYYNEMVPFDRLPANQFTLRTVFNFPTQGLQLYRMTTDGLVLQNLDESYEYVADLGGAIPRPAHPGFEASIVETDLIADPKSPYRYTALSIKEDEGEKPTLDDDHNEGIRFAFNIPAPLESSKESAFNTTNAEQKLHSMIEANEPTKAQKRSAKVHSAISQTEINKGRNIRQRFVNCLTSCFGCQPNTPVEDDASSDSKIKPNIPKK